MVAIAVAMRMVAALPCHPPHCSCSSDPAAAASCGPPMAPIPARPLPSHLPPHPPHSRRPRRPNNHHSASPPLSVHCILPHGLPNACFRSGRVCPHSKAHTCTCPNRIKLVTPARLRRTLPCKHPRCCEQQTPKRLRWRAKRRLAPSPIWS